LSFGIFQVDWITVDTIIIITLILTLITVKIIKHFTRWRPSLVNEKLIQSKFYGNLLMLNSQKIKLDYWNFIKSEEDNINQPLLFILRTRRKIRFLQALIEGIASLGFSVIDIKFDILIKERTQYDLLEDLKEIIHSILNYMDQENQENYIIIALREKPINTIVKGERCKLQILINPKFSQMDYNILNINLRSDSVQKLVISEYSHKFIKNHWIKYFFKEDQEASSNLILIKNANHNFKYYETLLFGTFMELITQKIKNE
jgi:hypothetical protein